MLTMYALAIQRSPKGENIRLIMERNQIKDAVYVGDTAGDAQACRLAGVPMIYAAYGFGNVEGDYLTHSKIYRSSQNRF